MNPVQPVLETLDEIIKNVEKVLSTSNSTTTNTRDSKSETTNLETSAKGSNVPDVNNDNAKKVNGSGEEKPKKKQKEKKAKPPVVPDVPIEVSQFLQCDLRVGRVADLSHHPEADGLYILQVSYGSSGTRTVCAGLREFISDDELRDRLVVTICNLKPRKLRGISSEAMVLAGSVKSDDGEKESVVPLVPPIGAAEGDVVSVRGITGERSVQEDKFVSGKIWDKVVSRLSVINTTACYSSSSLMVGDSPVLCQLPDGAEIH